MQSSNIITAVQWSLGHPEHLGSQPTDLYYARLCTNILKKANQLFKQHDVPVCGSTAFALTLGHYIEDIVSNTHIFDSFRKLHLEMYGKKLPFYDLSEDYLDDEVNVEDIKFLVWDYVQQTIGDAVDAVINPDNLGVESIAAELYPLLCDMYEEAPEVKPLHDYP